VPIPGCSAITAALSASGVDASEFVFAGFAPPGESVSDWFNDLFEHPGTTVFFDTPHSITRHMRIIESKSVNRPIIVWRELTKLHEASIKLGTASPNAAFQARGEFVVVVGPRDANQDGREIASTIAPQATSLFDYLTKYPSMDESSALAMVACRFDLGTNEVRKAIKKHRILVKQQKASAD